MAAGISREINCISTECLIVDSTITECLFSMLIILFLCFVFVSNVTSDLRDVISKLPDEETDPILFCRMSIF